MSLPDHPPGVAVGGGDSPCPTQVPHPVGGWVPEEGCQSRLLPCKNLTNHQLWAYYDLPSLFHPTTPAPFPWTVGVGVGSGVLRITTTTESPLEVGAGS